MSVVEKAGMLVNGSGEVLGWIDAGADVEMQEGDVIISHHKSAEKAGLLDQFKALKEENKPAKVKKEKVEGEKAARVRIEVPTSGKYTVVKAGFGTDDSNTGRAAAFKLISECTSFDEYFTNAKPYIHTKRDGTAGSEIKPNEVMSYAIRRGVITVD